ncbi:MAG: hypothetical protein IPN36_00360 [Bacteroidetes bacterium]|nr:hypothetical protein [Bacteroidota bacterium]
MKKKCIDCGDAIIGRSDKKFCSDMCRNTHHNKYNGYRNALMRHVNNKLRKNRKILFDLEKSNKIHLTREELSIIGFDWQYFTEERKSQAGISRYCYDYGIYCEQDDRIDVICKPYIGRNHKGNYGIAAEEQKHYS